MKTLIDDIIECDAFISPDQLTCTCKCLIFGFDKGLGRDILQTAYYDYDVKKFYMKDDCLIENDLESYWGITVMRCVCLEPAKFNRDAAIKRREKINQLGTYQTRLGILKNWYVSAFNSERQLMKAMTKKEWLEHVSIMHDESLIDFYEMMYDDNENFTLLDRFLKSLENNKDNAEKVLEKLVFINGEENNCND